MSHPSNSVALGFIPALWVDPSNGDNGAASRFGNFPCKTLAAAKAKAKYGDWIFVMAGTYTERFLLKDGVNWYFAPGAIVNRPDVDGVIDVGLGAIFDDGPLGADEAVSCIIDGFGVFNDTHTLIENVEHYGSILHVEDPDSNIKFRCAKMTINGQTASDVPTISVFDCERVIVECDEWVGGATNAFNNAVYWKKGELHTRFKRVEVLTGNSGSYTFWGVDPDGTAADWYLQVDLLIHPQYTPIAIEGTSANYRTWITAQEIRGGPDGGNGNPALALGTIEVIGPCKVYVNAQKILATRPGGSPRIGPCIWNDGGEVWVTAQKLTGQTVANQTGSIPIFVRNVSGTLHLDCPHLERVGDHTGDGIRIDAGEFNFRGHKLDVYSGRNLVHNGGISRVTGVRMKIEIGTEGNDNVRIADAGCFLRDCALVAGEDGLSISANPASDIQCMGVCANKAKAADATVLVQALVVSADVT